jgi:lipopolysaccharide transport system ATP-binding protein
MPSQTHTTLDSGHSTPPSDDEVLLRVEGVSKKFCRSLKKSLWYGVCDIAGELLPGRKRQRVAGSELRVAVEEASGPATSYSPPVTQKAAPSDWVYALKDVSFEVKRGEVLGIIGRNGAGTQAAWQPLGRLPQAARRVRRRGKARINTTLLKMLNGLIKPDAGSITMRGRVASWSMLKTPQANGAPLHSLPATLYSSQRRRRPLGLTKKH